MHFHWFPFSDLHPLLCGSARLSHSIWGISVTLSSKDEDMVTELTRCSERLKFTCNCSVRFLAALHNSQQVGATHVFIDGWMYCKNKMCYMKIFISSDLTVCTPSSNSFFSPWFPSQPHPGLSLRTVTVGLYLLVPWPRCLSAHSLESTCPLCKR